LSTNLEGADLREAELSEAELTDVKLSNALMWGANLCNARLRRCNLANASLMNAKLNNASLRNADLSGVKLHGADLSNADLGSAMLSGADLMGANLSGVNLGSVNLSGADVRNAILNGADFYYANLRRVRGLFGVSRARCHGIKNAEHAKFSDPRDFASWAFLRFMGSLHLFSASNASLILVLLYAAAMRWYNDGVDRLHAWAANATSAPTPPGVIAHLADLAAKAPHLEKDPHFGRLLVAITLLCVATALFTFVCPEPIKEATETRWTRELNQPLIEYRSAMYHAFYVRYTVFVCLALGGGYSLLYLAFKVVEALRYLLG
jgi:hypothetical protein